jgi:hypothetical protein
LLLTSLPLIINAQEKPAKESQALSITLNIKDDDGNAVSGAQLTAGEGRVHGTTDANGSVTIKVNVDDKVTIITPAYEKQVIPVQDLLKDNVIKLTRSKLFMTSDDDIPLPFVTMKKRNVTGSYKVLSASKLEKYPSTDIRNAFSGLVNGMEVIEMNGSPGFSPE